MLSGNDTKEYHSLPKLAWDEVGEVVRVRGGGGVDRGDEGGGWGAVVRGGGRRKQGVLEGSDGGVGGRRKNTKVF